MSDHPTTPAQVEEKTKLFHNHLDVCDQCREHPFNLCSTGDKLLKDAASGLASTISIPSIPRRFTHGDETHS
jgi:hypothetical protein